MRLSTEIASSSYHTPHVSQILLAPPRLMAMVFAQCATAALLVEYAAGLALKRSAPKSWHTDINGSSTLSWIVGLIHQALIFPLIGFFALRPFLGSAASFQGESTFLCVAFHAALFAFWAKDCLLTTLNQLTWLHHAICLLAVVASAMGWLVRCVSVFTLGALILELGSGVNAACELRPGLALRLWCTPVMTLSNVCASCLVVWYAITFSSFGGGIGRWAAAIVETMKCNLEALEMEASEEAASEARPMIWGIWRRGGRPCSRGVIPTRRWWRGRGWVSSPPVRGSTCAATAASAPASRRRASRSDGCATTRTRGASRRFAKSMATSSERRARES